MNTASVKFYSNALGRHVNYDVILPADEMWQKADEFVVLYQLHGRSDDHTAWITLSNLLTHAGKYPFIVVLPDGGVSFWSDYSARERYETFMIEDLDAHVRRVFPAKPGKSAIGGLSMGGYGAMALALKHPDRFGSVWSHSSAFFDAARFASSDAPPENPEALDIFNIAKKAADLGAQRANDAAKKAESLPAIGFDCGKDDFLIEENRKFHAHLDELGIPHTYKEHEGAHTWAYWDLHVRDALAHHYRAFRSTLF